MPRESRPFHGEHSWDREGRGTCTKINCIGSPLFCYPDQKETVSCDPTALRLDNPHRESCSDRGIYCVPPMQQHLHPNLSRSRMICYHYTMGNNNRWTEKCAICALSSEEKHREK